MSDIPDEMDTDELRRLAEHCRGEGGEFMARVATRLDEAADRMEYLEATLTRKRTIAAIAEEMLVGSRREEEYNRRLERAGLIGDEEATDG